MGTIPAVMWQALLESACSDSSNKAPIRRGGGQQFQ